MNKKLRILHELWVCVIGGYAGIPQDTRTIFQVLSECDSIQLDGFYYLPRTTFPLRKKLNEKWRSEQFLQEFKEQRIERKAKNAFETFLFRTSRLFELGNVLIKNRFGLSLLDPKVSRESIWKEAFSKTVSEDCREVVLKNDFYFSDITSRDVLFSAHYGKKIFLNTEGYDFALFPDVRSVTVSPGTKKIVRYHDSFAFICPDFFQTNHSKMHLNSLKACVDDSYFVCNSEYTRNTLLEVFPQVEHKAFVVPLAIQPYVKKLNWKKLTEICLAHASNQICQGDELNAMKTLLQEMKPFDYILSLSTLEPRKNYIGLIRAWEKLNYDYKKNIKLVIVANKGWLSEEIEEAMRPHIKLGNIIHLCGISADDVPYLYSHAKLFAYLSFLEGFGIPPLEAMHCECPVLASNNLTHRWSMGDAAYYVDPYDVNDISAGMARLLYQEGAEKTCSELVLKSAEIIKRYSIDSIKNQWAELFEKLSKH